MKITCNLPVSLMLALVANFAIASPLDESIAVVNKEVSNIAGAISDSGKFIELIDAEKIKKLKRMTGELTKKIGDSQYVRNMQIKGVENKFTSGNNVGINTLAKKINTLNSNIDDMKVKKVKLNALARKLPNQGAFFKKAAKGAGIIGKATYAVDMAQKTGVIIAQYKEGELSLKESLNYALDAAAIIDTFFLIQGSRYIEKTFEGILDSKEKITNAIRSMIDSTRNTVKYFTKNAMLAKLNNEEYREKLSSTGNSIQLLAVIDDAKRENIDVLKQEYKRLSKIESMIKNRDSGLLSIQFDDDEKLQEVMLAQVEGLRKTILFNLKELNKKEYNLLYVETALLIKTDIEVSKARELIKKEANRNKNVMADISNTEVVLNNFIESTSSQINNGEFSTLDTAKVKAGQEKKASSEERANAPIEHKKQEADTLLSQNKKRAENYQSLYIKLKNDPSNRDLKRRVDDADRLLRESTAKYIAVRGEIRKTEPDYGQPAYSRNAIRSRIDEKFSAQYAVEQKIDPVSQEQSSQEQISKEAQLRKIQTKVSEFRSNKKSKQSKLNKLIRRQQAMPSVIKRYEIELKTLKFRVKILQAVSKIKKSFSRKRKTIKSLPKKVKDALKKAADRLGTNWQKMYILAERLYDKANQEATDLKIRIVKTSNLSTREALLVTRLKREIKSLESQINVATSNAGRIQRELAKLTNEQQTYNKELTTLQQAATSVEAPITKHSYNYNEYSPSSLVSLGDTITHPEQPENEVIQTTQLDQQENQRQAEEQAIREFNDSQRVEIAEAAPNQPEQPTTPPTTPAPETPAGKYRGIYSAISPTLHSYYYIEQADSAEFGKGSANQNVALNPEIVAKNINTGSGDHFGDYQYTALGQWNSDNHVLVDPDNGTNHHLNGGYWVIGQDATDIPAQGSASYSGELNGDYMNSSGSVSRGIMGGTIGLNVAFSNKTISGNLFVTKSGDFYSAAEFSNAPIGQSIDTPTGVYISNIFQTDMTITSGGVGTSGKIGGFLYGQGAAEIGGGWQIGTGVFGTGASGVFRAKQSQPTSPNLNPSLEWGGWGSVVGSDTTSSGPDSYQYASTGTESPHNALPKGGSSTQINLDGVNQSVTATPDYGDYDYVAWGTWDGGSSTTFERYDGAIFNDVKGHWAYGQALGADDIPRYGSANYAGQVMGGYVSHHDGIVEANSISGDINMIVGFRDGNNSLSGTMNLDRNGSDWATATFNTQNARANPTDPDFKTPLNVVNGGNGELNGAFFGANAAEVGGSFYIDKQHGDGGGAAGVYRAKKQ